VGASGASDVGAATVAGTADIARSATTAATARGAVGTDADDAVAAAAACASVLFLRGDRSLETVPAALRGAGITCAQLVVYTSCAADPADLRAAWTLATADRRGAPGESALALVFFSPSGFEAAFAAGCPALLELARVGGARRGGASASDDGIGGGGGGGTERAGGAEAVVVVAIGATTAAAVAARGVRVAAVAASPDADGLSAAVAAALVLAGACNA
jgi:uroporphyrinogen-III synthase